MNSSGSFFFYFSGSGILEYLPVLAVVRQLLRVAGTSVRARDPALGQVHRHHVVDVLEDDLVAVKEHDALF